MTSHDDQTPKTAPVGSPVTEESARPSPAQKRPDEGQAASPESVEPGQPVAPVPGDLDAEGAYQPEGDEDGELEVLEEELSELEQVAAQRDEYLALAQRTHADFENYRKRMAKEARVAEARGVIKMAKELLPALDNLSRALDSAATDDPLLEGVRLVQADLLGALARAGIEPFSPAGEVFDPNEHEAMAQQPVENAEPGTVVEVYQAGYRANGTIIRPARVVVAA